MKRKITGAALLLVLGIVSVYTSYLYNQEDKIFSWEGTMWADRAGYYIYLPAFFMNKFEAKQIPEKMDEKTGYGFSLNLETNKIETKYTYGVAALLSPFFVATHFYHHISGLDEHRGWSVQYMRMIQIAAIFYLLAGLFLLNLFLKKYFSKWIRYTVLFLIYCGSNLFYYTICDPLMSHVYSFFLFSGFLFFMNRFLEEKKFRDYIFMCFFAAAIVLVRPANMILLFLFFLWDIQSYKEIIKRILIFLQFRYFLVFALILMIVFLPQLLYWKYLTGSFLHYSYENETFSNWVHPKFLEVWFSTINGAFLYTPLFLLLLAGNFLMLFKKTRNGITIFFLLLTLTYIISSWYVWYFGCSFGQRSYVEYLTVLSVPFGYLIKEISVKRRIIVAIPVFLLIAVIIRYNIGLSACYGRCFFGSTWDWYTYSKLLEKSKIISEKETEEEISNDFENEMFLWGSNVCSDVKLSGDHSVRFDSACVSGCKFGKILWNIEYYPGKVTASAWILNKSEKNTNAELVLCAERDGQIVQSFHQPVDPFLKQDKWSEVKGEFKVPPDMEGSVMLSVYISNPARQEFYVDDLKMVYLKKKN